MKATTDLAMTNYFDGIPIHITTKEYQCRTHHKRRINKKWRKRYGMVEVDVMSPGQIIMTNDGTIWMTKGTFKLLCGLDETEVRR